MKQLGVSLIFLVFLLTVSFPSPPVMAMPAMTMADEPLPSRLGSIGSELPQKGEFLQVNGDLAWHFVVDERFPAFFEIHRFGFISTARPSETVLIEANFEWETHATNFNVDYIFVDHLLKQKVIPEMIIRVGLFRVPLGLFNEYLQSTLFREHLHSTPLAISNIVGAPYSDRGIQLRGLLSPNLNFALFVVNGLQETATSGNNLRLMRNNRAEANGKALGGRLGWTPLSGLEVGLSGYLGEIQAAVAPARMLNVLDFDFRREWDNYGVLAEYVYARQNAPGGLIEKSGYYIEVYTHTGIVGSVLRYEGMALGGAAAADRTKIAGGLNLHVHKYLWYVFQYEVISNPGVDIADNALTVMQHSVF